MRASVVVFLSTAVVAWAQRGVQQPLAFQNVANPVTCGTLIQWTGGTATFTLEIQDSSWPYGTALKVFTSVAGRSFQWNGDADIPPSMSVFFRLYDSTAATADSNAVSIYSGNCASPSSSRASSTTVLTSSSTSTHTTSTSTNSSSSSTDTSSIPNTSSSASRTTRTGDPVTFSALLPQDPASPSDASNTSSSISGDNVADSAAIGSSGNASSSPNIAVIIGVVFGGLIALVIILAALFIYLRRRRSQEATYRHHSIYPITSPHHPFHSIHSRTGPSERWSLSNRPAFSISEVPFTGGSSPTIGDLPPAYVEPKDGSDEHPEGGVGEAEEEIAYEGSIGKFYAANRDLISPELEVKLRAAQYLPESNPSDVSAKYWRAVYHVSFFELRRLQKAYDRTVATQAASNAPTPIPQPEPLQLSVNEKRRRSSGRV